MDKAVNDTGNTYKFLPLVADHEGLASTHSNKTPTPIRISHEESNQLTNLAKWNETWKEKHGESLVGSPDLFHETPAILTTPVPVRDLHTIPKQEVGGENENLQLLEMPLDVESTPQAQKALHTPPPLNRPQVLHKPGTDAPGHKNLSPMNWFEPIQINSTEIKQRLNAGKAELNNNLNDNGGQLKLDEDIHSSPVRTLSIRTPEGSRTNKRKLQSASGSSQSNQQPVAALLKGGMGKGKSQVNDWSKSTQQKQILTVKEHIQAITFQIGTQREPDAVVKSHSPSHLSPPHHHELLGFIFKTAVHGTGNTGEIAAAKPAIYLANGAYLRLLSIYLNGADKPGHATLRNNVKALLDSAQSGDEFRIVLRVIVSASETPSSLLKNAHTQLPQDDNALNKAHQSIQNKVMKKSFSFQLHALEKVHPHTSTERLEQVQPSN